MNPSVASEHVDIEFLIERAKNGSTNSLGVLLDRYRPLLMQLAKHELDVRLVAKIGLSDVVQDTCMEAGQSITVFRGRSIQQLTAWLTCILHHNLANCRRYYSTEKREVRRERSSNDLPADADSANGQNSALTASDSSPLTRVIRAEERRLLESALAKLDRLDRKVIELRSRDGLCYEDLAVAIGKSPEATRKIWARAVVQLQSFLKTEL